MSQGSGKFIRIWQEVDPEEVKNHLMLIEEFHGVCGKCRHLGLNFLEHRSCPECGAEFYYLATKLKDIGAVAKIVRRVIEKNLPVKVIDRDDFDRSSAKDAIGDLFKKS